MRYGMKMLKLFSVKFHWASSTYHNLKITHKSIQNIAKFKCLTIKISIEFMNKLREDQMWGILANI